MIIQEILNGLSTGDIESLGNLVASASDNIITVQITVTFGKYANQQTRVKVCTLWTYSLSKRGVLLWELCDWDKVGKRQASSTEIGTTYSRSDTSGSTVRIISLLSILSISLLLSQIF
jgi:hypothetical protein